MSRTFRTSTVVLPGGRIELTSAELRAGDHVDVTVVQSNGRSDRSMAEILEGYAGGSLFRSAAEVDAYMKRERESWSH